MVKQDFTPAVVNLPQLLIAIRCAAFAEASAHYTRLAYEHFDSNALLDYFFTTLTGEPGFGQVQQDWPSICRERQRLESVYLQRAMDKAALGPSDFIANCNLMDQTYRMNLEWTNSVFRRALEINSNIEHRLRMTMNTCATIKFGATVGVAIIPLFVGAELALTAVGVSLVYSVGQDLIKDIGKAATADVIAFDTGKDTAKAAVDRGVDWAAKAADHSLAQNLNLEHDALSRIDVLTRRLSRDLSEKKAAQLTRRLDRLQQAAPQLTRNVKVSAYATKFGKALPVVFAAKDIFDAAVEFREDWK